MLYDLVSMFHYVGSMTFTWLSNSQN